MARRKPKFVKERPPDQSAVDHDWRLFLAIPMPARVQELLARVSATLGAHDWPVRWVGAESAHLTLHFIGETPPERGELVRLGLGSAVARHTAFSLETGDLGVFPHFGKPRVLWLGLIGEVDRLAALQTELGKHLEKLDFEVDSRLSHPHITLGRVRDDPPANLGAQVQQAFNEPEIGWTVAETGGPFEVTEVLLIRSYLKRDGAWHEPIARYPLVRKVVGR